MVASGWYGKPTVMVMYIAFKVHLQVSDPMTYCVVVIPGRHTVEVGSVWTYNMESVNEFVKVKMRIYM